MEGNQNHTDDEQKVNERARHSIRNKSNSPENNQNCRDDKQRHVVRNLSGESFDAADSGNRPSLQSCKTTVNRDLLTLILPLYSIKPSFLNLFMKKFTRERVVPTIFESVSWETFGSSRFGCSFFP
jgi:hypothetical protein